jgi:hypothetical protein
LAIVGVKGGETDVRPSAEEREKSDMHLKTMEKKAPKRK